MTEIIEKALSLWGLDGAPYHLVAARENAVYRISITQRSYALRLHRQGYRSDAELCSELNWMAAVERGGILVPVPIQSVEEKVLCFIDGVQIDLLSWLGGQTMADLLPDQTPNERAKTFFDLGREMAKLHLLSDEWVQPPDFDRVHWNIDGLLGEQPLWDRFWENPGLSKQDRDLCDSFRNAAKAKLMKLKQTLDYGLIHADLVPNNVLVKDGTIQLIDFDDGGFGFRIFEVATALLKHRSQPDFIQLKDSLINGYHSVRPLDLTQLDLFLALRAVTYVGWNITRMKEADGPERNTRFIETFRDMAQAFLKANP